MYEKNIALFIYQIQYLLYNKNIPSYDQSLINSINAFIILYHKEYFNLLYEPNLIDQLLEEEYLPLQEDYIINLLIKYKGYDNYIKLIDSIDSKTISKITNLVYKFIEYLEEAIVTYNQNQSTYTRILQ